MSLGLLSPLNLLAALAVALPVVIHLLRRKREATVDFPAVRFLVLAQRRSSRRLRLRRILLLLLRCLLLLLFALVLARPVLTAPGASFREGEAGSTAIILDTSLSMTLRTGAGTRFDEARALAVALVSRGGARERFALIEAAVLPGAAAPPVWRDRAGCLAELQGATARPAVADFSRAFAQAYQLLRGGGSAQKRIVVVSDLARGGWEQFSADALPAFDAAVPVRVFHLGGGPGNRAGILRVQARGENRVAGELREVTAEVANFGAAPVVPLELWLDGKQVSARLETIAPGTTARVVFPVRPGEGGAHRCEVRLPADAYDADDRRLLGLDVAPPVKLLLVDGEPGLSLVQGETFFLREALGVDRITGTVPVQVSVVGPEALPAALAGAQVVVLANVPAPGPATGAALARLVSGGGGLAVFWGEACDGEAYRGSLPGLLPAAVTGRAEAPPDRPWRVGPVDYGAEVFSVFRPPAGGTLATAAFTGRALLGPPQPAARVLARFEDGPPWVLAQEVGRGRVLLAASTADLAWNDLPTKPAFVPLVQRVALWLAGSLAPAEDDELTAGEEKAFTAAGEAAGSRVTVTAPGGRAVEVAFRSGERGARAVFPGTGAVGFYAWSASGAQGLFAVNVPAAESDLTPLAAERLAERLRPARAEVVTIAPGRAPEESVRAGVRSLTRPLLALLLLALLAEMVLAGPRVGLAALLRRLTGRPRSGEMSSP